MRRFLGCRVADYYEGGKKEKKKGVMVMVIIIQPIVRYKEASQEGKKKKITEIMKKRESGNISRLTYIHSGTHATGNETQRERRG